MYGVAFYNVENLFDTINNNGEYDLEFSPQGKRHWDKAKYLSKIHNLAFAINKLKTDSTPNGPAAIGIAEVENRSVLEDLVKDPQLKKQNYQIVHHDSPDRRGIDVALIYNPKLFKVQTVTNHTLHIADMPDFRTRDQMCVTGKIDGKTISIIVNHWPSRLGGEEQSRPLRMAAAALSKHIADSVMRIDPSRAIVIMGDLNDDPFNESCAETVGAQRNMEDVEAGGWFNPWWNVLESGVGSLAYRGKWNLFDQIILNYNLLAKGQGVLKYVGCKVLNDVPEMQQKEGYPLRTYSRGEFINGFSDHFPTQIFLRKNR